MSIGSEFANSYSHAGNFVARYLRANLLELLRHYQFYVD